MYELSLNILCSIGFVYLFWRIVTFLRTLLRLAWKCRMNLLNEKLRIIELRKAENAERFFD
jgi:hypothetical protein